MTQTGAVASALVAGIVWAATPFSPPAAQATRTPGGVVMLAVNADDRRRTTEVAAALVDQDPLVRAAAARVAGAMHRPEIAETVQDAIAIEPDPIAAAEELRALLHLRGVQAVAQARTAASRLGGLPALALLEWFARTQPADFVPYAVTRLADPATADGAARVAALAVRQTASLRESVSSSVAGSGDVAAWLAYLAALGRDADVPEIKIGLASSSPGIRTATLWQVAGAADGTRLHARSAADAALGMASSVVHDGEWSAFAVEILQRRTGKRPAVDGTMAFKSQMALDSSQLSSLAHLGELTKQEQASLDAQIPGWKIARGTQAPVDLVPSAGAAGTEIATLPVGPPGLLASVLRAANCAAGDNETSFGAASVQFERDGWPKQVAADTRTVSGPCAGAFKALAATAVAPIEDVIGGAEAHWFLLPMSVAALACADQPPARTWPSESIVEGHLLAKPKMAYGAKPVYPESLRQARMTAQVGIDVTLSETGCVARARVVRPAELQFNIAALNAVSRWRFEPITVNGRPIALTMNVRVRFSLE